MERERLNFSSANAVSGNVSVNPTYPYVGDPLPASNAPPLITGVGTAYPTTWTPPPSIAGSVSNLGVWTNPSSALSDFLNVQYLSVEAVCAVTRARIKPGEPVLILDEHIISKPAFTRLLRESFEKMITPKVETMHEISDYDS
jgi:hypothetical protein